MNFPVFMFLIFFISALDLLVMGLVDYAVNEDDSDFSVSVCITPTWFHGHTSMNKFGCWFCTLVLVPFTPFSSVYRFLYWLCHI